MATRNNDMWVNEIFELPIFSDPEQTKARDRAFEAADALAKSGNLTQRDLLNLGALIEACCAYGNVSRQEQSA